MDVFSVGIIGVGSVGKRHAKVFSSLGADVTVLGVVDTNGDNAARIAEEIGTKYYTDYRDLLSFVPDLVVICTPHFLHREIGEAAAKAGCHILMEKPLAHTMEDAIALQEVCRKENVQLAVSFVHRYRQEFTRAQQLIAAGEVGTLQMSVDIFGSPGGRYIPSWIWQNKYSGGGIVMYSGIHSIDWQCWLMGSDVANVFAHSLSTYKGSDVEDGIAATLQFENGSIGTLIGNQPDYPIESRTRNTELYGTKGCIRLRMGEYLQFDSGDCSYKINIARDEPFIAQALDVVDAIREGRTPWIGGRDGLRAQAIIAALYKSADTGKPEAVEKVE
ncbi:MAG: Gfo/Idh/MocA family oxidoreductase [Spirochaetaceae bacterium]|nr:MAG: Gfo/Idh/MocA family oxidoreductase [Spirochaetaceae bacterium]